MKQFTTLGFVQLTRTHLSFIKSTQALEQLIQLSTRVLPTGSL